MSVQDSFAGRQGNCPRCKQPFTVPAQSQAPGQTPPPAAAPPPAPPAYGAPPPPQPGFSRPGGAPHMTQPYDGAALVQQANAQAAAAGGGAARLEVVHGPPGVVGNVYDLIPGRSMVLGRDPGADLTIASDRVSRRHCQFVPQGNSHVLVDMGSANGTLVNQTRIDGRKVLLGGEYIQAGDCLFRYCE